MSHVETLVATAGSAQGFSNQGVIAINSGNPAAIFLVLDQSGSMDGHVQFEGVSTPKKDALVAVADAFVQDTILMCTPDGQVKDRFMISALGFGGGQVRPAFLAPFDTPDAHPISSLAAQVPRQGTKVVRGETIPCVGWLEARADGDTPLSAGLASVAGQCALYIQQHPDGPPPMVFVVTDGAFTDADPRGNAARIRAMCTSQGPAQLFFIGLSDSGKNPVIFPADPSCLPGGDARLLFEMSSELHPQIVKAAQGLGLQAMQGSRALIYNARIKDLLSALLSGSRAANRNANTSLL